MKFHRIKAIVLLLLFSFSNFILANESIKLKNFSLKLHSESRRKRKSHSLRTKTTGILGTIWQTIKGIVTDPINLLYFVFGIASAWFPEMKEVYTHVKEDAVQSWENFKDCVKIWSTEPPEENTKTAEVVPRPQFSEAWEKIETITDKDERNERKKAYCVETQSSFDNIKKI